MKIKTGALEAGGRRWDNVIEFTDLDPTPAQWPDLRLVISRGGGRIAHLDPIRVVILDCQKRSGKAYEVRELVANVKKLCDQWEAEEYNANR